MMNKIILHNARCLTRFVNSSSDVDVEYFINKLYRLLLHVAKFLRNWHLRLAVILILMPVVLCLSLKQA